VILYLIVLPLREEGESGENGVLGVIAWMRSALHSHREIEKIAEEIEDSGNTSVSFR
jgi:hypothetical protein